MLPPSAHATLSGLLPLFFLLFVLVGALAYEAFVNLKLRRELDTAHAFGRERDDAARWLGSELATLHTQFVQRDPWALQNEASRLGVELATARTDAVALTVRAQQAEGMVAALRGDLAHAENALGFARLATAGPDYFGDVRAFHAAMCPEHTADAPNWPDGRVLEVRVKLVREEAEEFADAVTARDFPAAVDALADVLYVTFGGLAAFGVAPAAVWQEVHRSNMAKLLPDGTVRRRDDGKVLKPDGWTPPDVAGVLRSLGWDGNGQEACPACGSRAWAWMGRLRLSDPVRCTACPSTIHSAEPAAEVSGAH